MFVGWPEANFYLRILRSRGLLVPPLLKGE
jgi:hypothetical protein